MKETLYDLFRLCFPDVIRSETAARELLGRENLTVLRREIDGKTAGVSVFCEDRVILLCVLPEFRGRGIGSALLRETEEAIAAAGYGECSFCAGNGYLTPGVPLYEGNREFFEKRGYSHSWGDCECVDMSMSLADFVPDSRTPDGIVIRWAKEDEIAAVCDCVADAHESFVKYYRDPAKYRESAGEPGERVLAAVEKSSGVVCGALLVGAETEEKGVGSVGCTATRHACRNRGIATSLVKTGTGFLRDMGLPTAFLGYTYTDIIPMYARSGYSVCRKYLMAKKKLTKTVLDVPFLDQRKDYPTGCESVSACMLLWANGFGVTVDEFIDECLPVVPEPRQVNGEWIGPDPRQFYPGDPRTEDGWGCFAPAVKKALDRYFGLRGEPWEAVELCGLSLSELCARYVDEGQPAVVFATMGMEAPHEYRTWKIEGTDEFYTWLQPMHCLLLTGHDRENFYFNDPLCAKNQPYPMEKADFAHRGMGETAVVIRRKTDGNG